MNGYIKDVVIYSKQLKEYLKDVGGINPIATIQNPNHPELDAWIYRPTTRLKRLREEYSQKDGATNGNDEE